MMTANHVLIKLLKRGLRPSDIAMQTGLKRPTISQHIRGIRRNPETQAKIAGCAGLTVRGLFGEFAGRR